jgi:carboxypeptidase C (cathepsin A)
LPADLQSKDLDVILHEAEAFAMNELLPAMVKGGSLSDSERDAVAAKMARYAGISKEAVLSYNLMVPTSFFWKELLRKEGLTVGRLDSRYRGIDRMDAGDRYDFDPALTSWNHAFAPAFNIYAKNVLNYQTDLTYNLFGPVSPWDRSNETTGYDLGTAMRQNPYLNVMIQSGYFDGGTDYFNAKYSLRHIDPTGKMKDRTFFKGYRSGHMMYLRAEDLATSNEDIRQFIENSKVAPGMPAKY